MVFAKNAGKLSEALITDGKRGFGYVCVAGGKEAGGVFHALMAKVGGGTLAESLGEGAAEVRRTLGGGGGELS